MVDVQSEWTTRFLRQVKISEGIQLLWIFRCYFYSDNNFPKNNALDLIFKALAGHFSKIIEKQMVQSDLTPTNCRIQPSTSGYMYVRYPAQRHQWYIPGSYTFLISPLINGWQILELPVSLPHIRQLLWPTIPVPKCVGLAHSWNKTCLAECAYAVNILVHRQCVFRSWFNVRYRQGFVIRNK